MNNKIILNQCQELSPSEITCLIDELKELQREKFNKLYKKVFIYPGEIITGKIKDETGYDCYHVKPAESTSGRGTHIIVIPMEQYTEELKADLIERYDDKW